MIQPLLIAKVLTYFDGQIDLKTALTYAALLSSGYCFNSILHHPIFLIEAKYGTKMRLACAGVIYKKV